MNYSEDYKKRIEYIFAAFCYIFAILNDSFYPDNVHTVFAGLQFQKE